MKVLITGATGFVGRSLVVQLAGQGHVVVASVRSLSSVNKMPGVEYVVGDLSADFDWYKSLVDVDVVVHTAARVHVMDETVANPLAAFREINTAGSLNLARQSADAGVKRFIFISTIGVNGLLSYDRPFLETDRPNPHNPYAVSKWEAEQGLTKLAENTGMEVVVIRPPLIYGPGAPGNFEKLLEVLDNSKILPLGAVKNQRSFVALDNLVDFIGLCITHPQAANQTFLISDGEDVSTTELLQKTAIALGKKAKLIAVPTCWLAVVAKLLGKAEQANRLLGSLQIDSSKAQQLLGWKPVITMDQQLKKTAEAFLNEKNL